MSATLSAYFVTASGNDGLPIIEEYRTEEAARYGIELLQSMGHTIEAFEWEGKNSRGKTIFKNLNRKV